MASWNKLIFIIKRKEIYLEYKRVASIKHLNTYVKRFVPIFDNPLHGTGDEDVLRLNYSLKNFYIWGNRIYLRRAFVPDFDDPLRGTGDEDVGHKCVPLQHGVYCILVYWYVICFLLTWIISVCHQNHIFHTCSFSFF